MALLTAAEYPSIRAALDVGLDAVALPDSIIELPIYGGSAELEILRRDPDAYERTGLNKRRVMNAIIYLTAAYLAPAIPKITSETLGDYSYGRQVVDWTKLAIEMRSRADQELSAVTQGSGTIAIPSMFGVASGRRGA